MDASDSQAQPTPESRAAIADRREHRRFAGPFDGRRVGLLETPVQIYDLGRGGCYINSTHEQQPGIRLTLKIDLPGEGWVTVAAETLPRQNDYGFAVRFTSIDPDNTVRLDSALKRLEDASAD